MTRDPRAENGPYCLDELTWQAETLTDAGRMDEAEQVCEESLALINYLENDEREARKWLEKAPEQAAPNLQAEVRAILQNHQRVFHTIGKKQEAEKISGLLAMLKAEVEKRSLRQ